MNKIELLSVVAVMVDLPEEGIRQGQVGTVVEELAQDVVLVEFADLKGETYAELPIPVSALMLLRHEPLSVH